MKLDFLGTADSGGIPVHNCKCLICQEYRENNKINLATSAYLTCKNGEIILLDAGIENISTIFDNKKIKAIFLTHFHADHTLGLLRLRYSAQSIECYHPKDKKGFADLFKHTKAINYIENTPFTPIKINELIFTPIPLKHSKNTTGYLIESENKTIAYLTDCAGISKESMNFLLSKNIDECYIDAGLAPNFNNGNHLNYEEATKLLDRINAKKSHLIHASHNTLTHIKSNNIKLKYNFMNIS
ncbi:carbon-phosphorus lyase complex accessory protein [Arcobacter nitrofigilis DSM 7299]|uniref:Carbon-phosphorus lyase complex accessory protein n=1 Tax=Arcobacter nitrofigilis (strain ATCC 33309 / DSM 7299 / CCUG 15893 / LMG 7604 / NCTC 12251 / CI) TaxID=572480 RepID=D5V548_ARCNC|nr:MBL fold metallo-hydrolase [Arcobacter nitrofigilis]ADG92010.1 carbon-phosphorus lyase complex accessory protein [Arcobacter nitrofigilis DSM 7299]